MNNTQRAHIFNAFDSLNSLEKIAKESQKSKISRYLLSPEDCEILNEKILSLKKGMVVEITYYYQNSYIQINGELTKIDLDLKWLYINRQHIYLKDLFDIKIIQE